MVDVKREDITLQDWTKGISADEFAWGSYFYSDGIQSWYSTKWFKLWPYISNNVLNERNTWYPVAVCRTTGSILYNSTPDTAFFCSDGRLEMTGNMNGSESWTGGSAGWWAVFVAFGIDVKWVWGYVYWDYALAFTKNYVTKVKYKDTYSLAGQTITSPRFENNAAWWTVWSWWTLTDDWMDHAIGYTGTLVTTANAYASDRARMAFKVTGCTKWTITMTLWGGTLTSPDGKNWWFVGTTPNMTSWTPYTITITPSSDFDGYVEAVNFNVFKTASEEYISWLTSADKHMAVEWGGDIYISSWNTIDILSTADRTISDSKQLIRKDEEIVALSQQAESLIIWATDWLNSHQYYWNWVDGVATEVINRPGQVIKWVTNTETICYVLAWEWNTIWQAYRLYAVSWYQRSLIASNAYKVQGSQWNLEHFHPSKKFAFNDVGWSESMCMWMDNLYIPGCDWIYQYWQTIPWLPASWSRPIKYQNWADRLFLYGEWFTYRYNKENYYSGIIYDRYTNKWYLVTDSLYWDKLGTRKALEKIKLSYKSLTSTDWNIKVYAIVDDDYFWRFDVTWVTNRPAIWDVYEVAEDTTARVIDIQKTSSSEWTITFATVENWGSLSVAKTSPSKVSGDGDNTLTINNNYDNMCLIKTIETATQGYWADFIFWKDFVNNYIPYWHKIQFVIELNKNNSYRNDYRTPEVYELSFVSDITDVTL